MGTHWSNGRHCARENASMGIAGAYKELPGSQECVDAMVCDPATSAPSNSAWGEGREGNLQDNVDCGAPGERNSGRPTITTSGNGMFNNAADGRLRRANFSDFSSFLPKFPPGDESNFHDYRNFTQFALVSFLEERNDKNFRAASQHIEELNASHQSEVAQLTSEHVQQVEKVSRELLAAQAEVASMKRSLDSALSETQDRKSAVQVLQGKLEEVRREKLELSKHRDSMESVMKADFEAKLRQGQEDAVVKENEVLRLNSIIEQKQNDFANMEATRIQLTTECQKLKTQLAAIEQKSAQESITSGSYADGHVNPSMLEIACKAFDKAADNLVRFLHGSSITSKSSLKSLELQSFFGKISSARPADFSRPAQVKHVWGHWICTTMFHGFENVFLDIGGDRTSPLDFKKHASESFQSFQKYKDVSPLEYQKSCPMFRAFCIKTYPLLFPLNLVDRVLQLDLLPVISCNRDGRLEGDGKLYLLFLDVAKAIWLLHKLSFAFDPPAIILRMASGTPFDKQYHESLVKDADNGGTSARVVLMVRPAFRIRNTIIKSRVFLTYNRHL